MKNVKWGEEIYLKDLFIIKRGKRLTVENRLKGNRPLVTAGYENTGVAEFIGNLEQEIFLKDTITIDMFANTFYRNYSYSADDNILVLFDIKPIPSKAKIFIVNLINKVLGNKFSYGKQYRMGSFEQTKIQLPTKNGEIDFDFMESFIAELEAERIAELEAYLLATGLKNYTLTAEEKQVLQDFVNGKFTWDEYKIEDVLQWQSQKEIDPLKLEELKDETEMIYPFYGQSTINNGIISYHQLTNKVVNNKDGKPTILIHSNNQNIVYLETPFYLKDGHGATSVLQGEKLSKVNQIVIVASIDKVIKNKFSYNNKATKIELKSTVINLPTQNNQPNYAIMETFISAIQKLVIKDVVLYADRKIAATKTVVNK